MLVPEVYKGLVGPEVTVTQIVGTLPTMERHPKVIVRSREDQAYVVRAGFSPPGSVPNFAASIRSVLDQW